MALQFLSDAEFGECELVVRLDLKGVEALLAAMPAALEAGLEWAESDAEGRPLKAFSRVSFRFLDPAAFAEPPAN